MAKAKIETDSGQIQSRTPGQIAWLHFRRNRVGVIAGIFSIAFLLASLLAPLEARLLIENPQFDKRILLTPNEANNFSGMTGFTRQILGVFSGS